MICTWPPRVPPMVGSKLTVRLHEAPTASGVGDIGQVVDVWMKSPVTEKLLICTAAVELLVIATVW